MQILTYHLAIDIGASSGRHILGWVEDGRMHLKEVYRFENRLAEKNGPPVAERPGRAESLQGRWLHALNGRH